MQTRSIRPHPHLLLLIVLGALSGGLMGTPTATTREVTSLADPGTGTCTPAACTLRQALASAQAGDTITFAPVLFANGSGRLRLTAGALIIATDLTIQGPGQRRLILDGNHTRAGCIPVYGLIPIRSGSSLTVICGYRTCE